MLRRRLLGAADATLRAPLATIRDILENVREDYERAAAWPAFKRAVRAAIGQRRELRKEVTRGLYAEAKRNDIIVPAGPPGSAGKPPGAGSAKTIRRRERRTREKVAHYPAVAERPSEVDPVMAERSSVVREHRPPAGSAAKIPRGSRRPQDSGPTKRRRRLKYPRLVFCCCRGLRHGRKK